MKTIFMMRYNRFTDIKSERDNDESSVKLLHGFLIFNKFHVCSEVKKKSLKNMYVKVMSIAHSKGKK